MLEVKVVMKYPQCDGRCQFAVSNVEECKCQCRGRYHGLVYRGHRRNIRFTGANIRNSVKVEVEKVEAS